MDALPEFRVLSPKTLDDVIAARESEPEQHAARRRYRPASSISGAASWRRRC